MLHFSLSEAICSKILLWVLYFQRKIVLTNKALRELKGWHYFGKNHYVSESTAQRGNSHIKTRTSQFLNDDLTLPRFAGSTSNLECQHINFQWQTHLSHQPKGMLAQGINDQNATIKRCSGASKRSIPGYVAQIFKSPSWRSALTDPGKVKYIREQKPPWCRLKGHCSIFSSLLIFIMYVCVYVYAHAHVCATFMEVTKSIGFPGAGTTMIVSYHCGHWEMNSRPSEEQETLLITEPASQSLSLWLIYVPRVVAPLKTWLYHNSGTYYLCIHIYTCVSIIGIEQIQRRKYHYSILMKIVFWKILKVGKLLIILENHIYAPVFIMLCVSYR